MAPPAPRTIIADKFVLGDLLGRGAMGSVYRAEQMPLGRTVAIKIINPDLARDPRMSACFHQEARAASRINHPNTISVIDFGQTADGTLYLVTEFIRGRTLAQVIAQEFPMPAARIVKILDQVLAGLHEAHSLGVVHRDLKPENVLLQQLAGGGDLVKVCDFGIAKLREPGVAERATQNLLWGTPEFMSPEQIHGGEVDGRTDLYSVGVILYEMLTGELPFSGGTPFDILTRHLREAPVPPRKRRADLRIVPELEAVALQALAKSPSDRYPSAAALRAVLERCLVAMAEPLPASCPLCKEPLPAEAMAFCPYCGAQLAGRLQVIDLPSTAPQRPRPVILFPLAFVGREHEVATLQALLTGQPGGRAVVIEGAPGAGKSRLVDEVLQSAGAQGYRCVRLGPDPSGVAQSWWPIRRAVGGVLDLPPHSAGAARISLAHLQQRARDAGLAAGDVQPGLAELFRIETANAGLELEVRRRECASAALRALRGRVDGPPTVLVFEDVGCYDRPSLALLERLVQAPGAAPLVVVVTCSTEEGAARPNFGGAVRIGLEPLAAGVIKSLVEDILGPHQHAEAAVLSSTARLPLFVEQGLRLVLEGGVVEGRVLPDLIAARIEALPPDARRALQATAVAGGEAESETIARMLRDGDDIDAALAVLIHRGIVTPRAHDTVAICHDFLTRVAYNAIPLAARREFHSLLFGLLGEGAADPAVMGYHGHAAGGGERVIPLLEQAGANCQAAFDDQGAIAHYGRALDLARAAAGLQGAAGPAPKVGGAGATASDTLLARLGLHLAEAMLWCSDVPQIEAVLKDAMDHAGKDYGCRALVMRGMARLANARGQHAQARDLLRGAIALSAFATNAALQAELYLELGTLLQRGGDLTGAVEKLAEGLMICTGGTGIDARNAPPTLWRMLVKIAEIHLARGEPVAALRFGAGGLKHAQRVRSRIGQARAHELLAEIHRAAHREGEAAQHRFDAIELMRDLGDRRSTAKLLLDLGSGDLTTGANDRARERFEEARALAQAVEWSEGERRSNLALHGR
ncbi:MAG: hypothetical protein EXR72_00090 [Myxococcales bacterium]|nr:hypothetical protein [Myxococcales bacterium]